MKKEQQLTNEAIIKDCDNTFNLALKAIAYAQSQIESGHDFSLKKLIETMRKDPAIEITTKEENIEHHA